MQQSLNVLLFNLFKCIFCRVLFHIFSCYFSPILAYSLFFMFVSNRSALHFLFLYLLLLILFCFHSSPLSLPFALILCSSHLALFLSFVLASFFPASNFPSLIRLPFALWSSALMFLSSSPSLFCSFPFYAPLVLPLSLCSFLVSCLDFLYFSPIPFFPNSFYCCCLSYHCLFYSPRFFRLILWSSHSIFSELFFFPYVCCLWFLIRMLFFSHPLLNLFSHSVLPHFSPLISSSDILFWPFLVSCSFLIVFLQLFSFSHVVFSACLFFCDLQFCSSKLVLSCIYLLRYSSLCLLFCHYLLLIHVFFHFLLL